ncbi:PqqD family protein [Aliiroseovarius sp.]|uniref:PqqD family protein n=1 Tax=Aliiroseovarius sp. TaxID=1872442 RepID=UPI00262F7A97|nr:PqqD family protein [Aliiroseovarius sp.]
MTETRYLQIEGLEHPVALEKAAPIEPLISTILAVWPHRIAETPTGAPPFATIRPQGEDRWQVITADAPEAPRAWDGLNTVCDLVAEMAWERLRSDPALLCLHAAAVDFGGRLVVFPNARRAGKSTLAIALARRGLPLYTDDFLPVRLDAETGTCAGVANGVLPRLRLPPYAGISQAFRNAVDRDSGPSNRQYKYLAELPVAHWGEMLPLGAMVVLDRQDAPTRPQLSAMAREDALASLITQNFARTRHAGAILRSIDVVTRHLPIHRLRYHCAEEAAAYLSTHPDLKALPATSPAELVRDDRQAPLERPFEPAATFTPDHRYQQAPGVTGTVAGEDCFLADGSGRGIFRLNPVSAAIWTLLEEPTDLAEVTEILTSAFPDIAADRIATDCTRLMCDLARARLICPAPREGITQ